jgi:hypothetical protein
MTRTAHCSCGALRVEVSADPDAVGTCHCGRVSAANRFGVRRWCLGPFLSGGGRAYKKEHVRAEGPPTSMSATGKSDERLGCIFARRAERRCFGRPI